MSFIFENKQKEKENKDKGKLRKTAKLGSGTYGTVYEAVGQNSMLAIKRNTIPNVYHNTSLNIRELDILLIVRDHPFCIKLEDYYFENPFCDNALSPILTENSLTDKIFFAMEKGDMDMSDWLKSGSATIPEKKLLMVQLLLSIEFLHSRDIYHRDIKPSNIILFFESIQKQRKLKYSKISDFGLSQFYTHQAMAINNVITIWYRAPEVALNKHYDTKVDIWSVGCIFFELFSNGGNKRLYEAKTDEDLVVFITKNFRVSKEDFILSHLTYKYEIPNPKEYENIQRRIPDIKDLFKLTPYIEKNFNLEKIDGLISSVNLSNQQNNGVEDVNSQYSTLENYFDLLRNMLKTNPNERFSATDCLNHIFFKGYESYIDKYRALYDIDRKNGTWISKLPSYFLYKNDQNRKIAMKWFNIIYSNRESSPISIWWSNRLFFHAIDLFDKYMIIEKEKEKKSSDKEKEVLQENQILIIIITCLFISSKYFRVMLDNVGLNYFIIGFNKQYHNLVITRVEELEEHMLKNVFKCRLYFPTIYEQATEYLSEFAIKRLLEIITNCELESGLTVEQCWKKISDEISKINSCSIDLHDKYPVLDIDGL